jgi:hypothetical protein
LGKRGFMRTVSKKIILSITGIGVIFLIMYLFDYYREPYSHTGLKGASEGQIISKFGPPDYNGIIKLDESTNLPEEAGFLYDYYKKKQTKGKIDIKVDTWESGYRWTIFWFEFNNGEWVVLKSLTYNHKTTRF